MDEPTPLNLSVHDLTRDTCRWPYGDGPYTFCGHPVWPGSVYCRPHHAIAYTSGTQRDVDRQAGRIMGSIGKGRVLDKGVWA